MDADEFDVKEEAQASSDKLEALNNALDEAVALEAIVEQLDADLKAAKQALHTLRSGRVPDLMAELQMTELVFRGWKVTVDDFVSGSLPKDPEAKAKAVRWLEENDAGGLIKTDLVLAFGKSQHNEAIDLAERLKNEGMSPTVNSGVHPQTLAAFARERIRNGEPLEIDLLGLFVGKVAKMKRVEK